MSGSKTVSRGEESKMDSIGGIGIDTQHSIAWRQDWRLALHSITKGWQVSTGDSIGGFLVSTAHA